MFPALRLADLQYFLQGSTVNVDAIAGLLPVDVDVDRPDRRRVGEVPGLHRGVRPADPIGQSVREQLPPVCQP